MNKQVAEIRNRKRLSLRRQDVRTLSVEELRRAAGAANGTNTCVTKAAAASC